MRVILQRPTSDQGDDATLTDSARWAGPRNGAGSDSHGISYRCEFLSFRIRHSGELRFPALSVELSTRHG